MLEDDYIFAGPYIPAGDNFWQQHFFPLLVIASGGVGKQSLALAALFQSFYLMQSIHNELPEAAEQRAGAILSGDYLFGHCLKFLALEKRSALLEPLSAILSANIEGFCRGDSGAVAEAKADLAALTSKTAASLGDPGGRDSAKYEKAAYLLGRLAFVDDGPAGAAVSRQGLRTLAADLPGWDILWLMSEDPALGGLRRELFNDSAAIAHQYESAWRQAAKKNPPKGEKLLFFASIDRGSRDFEKALQGLTYSGLPLVNDFCHFLMDSGGKRLRPTLALLSASFTKDGDRQAMPLALALELIHMASLTHDDVIDRASLRRGLPTARVIWGEKMAVQLGDLLLAKVFELLAGYENQRIIEILAETSMLMCRGEFDQLDSISRPGSPDLGRCLGRIGSKTALLLAASCQTGALAAGQGGETVLPLRDYGYYLGVVFQIADDMLDLCAAKEKSGKERAMDLKQGLVTLPILLALANGEKARELNFLCRKKELSLKDIAAARREVKLLGGFAGSLEMAEQYCRQALNELDPLPDNPYKEDLRRLAGLIKNRAAGAIANPGASAHK